MLTVMSELGSHDAAPATHVVLSEFLDRDLWIHEVVVEEEDFPAEGSLLLFVVLGLQRERENRQGRGGIEKQSNI